MRILQLGKFYPIRGGVEKVMWDFTEGLSLRGVDCDMLCAMLPSDDVDEEQKSMAGREGRNTVIHLNPHGRVICVPAVAKKAATMISPAMVRWLRSHRGDYDIVHVHHPDPMAALALRLSGFKGKVIVHWHSDILKQRLLFWFYKPLQDWMLRRAWKVVGTTPVYVHESPHLAAFQDKVAWVPIGVRPVEYDPARAAALRARFPGKKIVFSLGRLVGYKGYAYLVAAARSLGDGYRVVIGGGGPLRDELNALIVAENVENIVYLQGYLSNEDVSAWYGACDLFVLSSIWKTEAFAIVQVEAMSCGKPVVATKIPGSGVSWVNGDGESGVNVEPCDADALAGAIKSLTGDEATYHDYSLGARRRYERMFTFDMMIDNVLKIYNQK